MEDCMFEWVGPFWGGDPGALENHVCREPEFHGALHRCRCGETHLSTVSEEDRG